MSTLNLTVPHQVTLNLTGLPACTRTYTKNPSWANADGWVAGIGTPTVSVVSSGLVVTATASVSTVNKPVTTVASTWRRVHMLVQLVDPEAPPAIAWISDSAAGVQGVKRLVSGTPVWISGESDGSAVTQQRLAIQKPTGAAQTQLRIISVYFDQLSQLEFPNWTLQRVDSNGTVYLASGSLSPDSPVVAQQYDLVASSSGTLTFVDREPSLVGNVTYNIVGAAGTTETKTTLTNGILSSGYGVLQRVGSATLWEVNVVEFSGRYEGQAQPLGVVGSGPPVIPTYPLGSRVGQLVLYFATLDAAQLVADDLLTGQVFMLRQDDTTRTAIDAYLVCTSLSVDQVLDDLPAPYWALTATYQETLRPAAQ